jgi:Transglutaminase-like superfamily
MGSVPANPVRPEPAARRTRGRWLRVLLVGSVVGVGATAAAAPVLHEYIDLGPGNGPVEPSVTGERGAPSRSGSVGPMGAAADADADADAEPGGAHAGTDSTFAIDRDTSRPERVSYSDPFTPTVVPFKRAMVFDGVNRKGDLLVQTRELEDVPMLPGPRPNDENFHASFELDLKAGERLPIPSVAPGSRLVLLNREPRVALRVGADSAENWFVTSNTSRHVRLTLQIVADRRVFGSTYPNVSWRALAGKLPPLPAEVKQSALDVARALGIDESASPEQAVAGLVQHFRRFSPSERRPTSHGLALYRELSLTARGICRHRSYAFMITALGLGIPARVALNEAHAWVEVYDGELWHRIDLGGAADQLEMDDQGRPRHVEPRDPFAWPDRRESGLAMVERRVTASAESPAEGAAGAPPTALPTDPRMTPSALSSPPPPVAPPPKDNGGAPDDPELEPPPSTLPAPAPAAPTTSNVHLYTGAARAERGRSLFVSGSVQDTERACNGARVDVLLGQPNGNDLPLGSLVSDGRGEFRGNLVIPWNAELGEHTLIAAATGCKP